MEFAQRLPGAGGKKGCGKVREWGARQDEEPVRQFFQETGMNSLQQDTCIIGIQRSPLGRAVPAYIQNQGTSLA